MNTSSTTHSAIEDTGVNIIVDGDLTRFTYQDLKNFHTGDSWFGCTVGFRVMQIAARELSEETSWSRDNLSVVSGHPGPGVRDAIELVTATVSSDRYKLHNCDNSQGCNRNMKFEWWISSNNKTVHIKLNNDIVPESFFTLLEIASGKTRDNKQADALENFNQMKTDLSNILWQQSLDSSFSVEFSPAPYTDSKAGT